MKAVVFYQDFELNANVFETKKIVMLYDKAIQIREFEEQEIKDFYTPDGVEGIDVKVNKQEFCNAIYSIMNHLEVPVGHKDRPLFEKAGHTSMSIGDFVLFEDGEIWAVQNMGWEILPPHKLSDTVKESIRKASANDEVANALIEKIERQEQTLTPCPYPLSEFYNYMEEVPKGTRVCTEKDCEECDEKDCNVRYCLIEEITT